MTDNEIIKALEYHVRAIDKKNTCIGCPLYNYTSDCSHMLAKRTFDLINRQKAEIESLESRIFALNDTNKILMETQEVYANNTLKEFAQRLKNEYADFDKLNEIIQIENLFLCIDDLVKEMTEGANE